MKHTKILPELTGVSIVDREGIEMRLAEHNPTSVAFTTGVRSQ